MFRLTTSDELLDAFRPRDRASVELPPNRTFPLTVLDYLAWPDEAGERVFVLFKAPGQTHVTGLAFRTDHSSSGTAARMCDWCHSTGFSDEIGLLVTDANSRKRVGAFLCRDLSCGPRVEDFANRNGKNVRDAMGALLGRMSRFAERALGITQQNRNVP